MRKCKDITHLVLEGEDRPLRLSERLAVRWHLLICGNCARFVAQVGVMRQAMVRWRNLGDDGGP